MSHDNFPTHFSRYLGGYRSTSAQYWFGPIADQQTVSPVTHKPTSTLTTLRTWQFRPYLCDRLAALCEEYMGGNVTQITFPGGEDRGACRVHWADGSTAIASYRTEEPSRAHFEARVLHFLNQFEAPVPNVLHFNGLLLIQEDLKGERLSTLLADADKATREALLATVLESLVSIHHAAEQAGLDQWVPVLGGEDDWIERHIRQLPKMAEALGILLPNAPPQMLRSIHDLLIPLKPRFIKWDARPGNAVVNQQGQVYWFDWENCGARNRLDDLVWLLCDESVPFCAETEQALLAQYLPLFADGLPLEAAYRYAYVAGVLHCTARLGLILHKKGDDEWWDPEEILAYDYVGVTVAQVQRLCYRASDWAAREPLVATLSPWFQQVAKRLVK